MTNTNNSNSARINIVCDGPYRMDWNSGKFVKIEPHTLEVGQLVTSHEYAMNTYEFVCISEAVDGVQQLVEIGGRHRRHNWVCRDNDRSTEQVFGIGLYYDPSGYRMPAEEIERHKRAADIQERWNARREENQRKADEKECRELREKWAGVLVPLSDIEDWKERDKQEKANFLNYLKHYHPHTKFTAKKSRGGGYYTISWQDGPTSSAIKTLCSVWHDHTFDGYTDYNEYTPTNFNKVFGGVTYSMDTNRSFSEAAKAAARADLLSICPEFAEYLGTGKDYRPEGVDDIPQHWLNITVNRHRDNPTARAIEEAGWREAANWNTINPDRILIDYLDAQDLTPAEDTTPTEPKPRKKSSSTDTATDTNEAPAEGLELVEIAGGVAVVGDSRTTYRNRKAIKAHGAKWNKEAQQWQATDPEAVAALRAWFGMNDEPTPDPTEQKTDSKNTDTPTGQKCPAPIITTADTSDPEAMKEAAENVREWCNTDQLKDPTPYAAEFDNVAALAWAVSNNYTPTEAEQMTAAALQLSAKMQRRANEINEATAAMEEANRQEYAPEQWEANREEIEEFEAYAEELAMYAEGLAAAVGVPDWQLCDVAAIPEPQNDPAQLALALIEEKPAPLIEERPQALIEEKPTTPTEATPVTDAEVYEQAARIRATYKALKAEAETETETPSNQKTDTTPSNQKTEEKIYPNVWAGKIDRTKKMQFAHLYDYKDGAQRHQPIIFYGTKKGLLSWIWQQLSGRITTERLTGDWVSMGRGRNEWRMYDENGKTAFIVNTQEFDAQPQLEILRAWNPDSLSDYERKIVRENDPNEGAARAHFNDLADNDPEGIHNVYYRIDVPYYVDSICTHNPEANEMAKMAVSEFYEEIIKILTADGWTNKNGTGKLGSCPVLSKGQQELYCHPQEISGNVNAFDVERIFNLLLTAKTFTTRGADDYGAARHGEPIKTIYPIGASCAVPVAA